jgi:hypothetical protein
MELITSDDLKLDSKKYSEKELGIVVEYCSTKNMKPRKKVGKVKAGSR